MQEASEITAAAQALAAKKRPGDLTIAEVAMFLECDPATGRFIWLSRARSLFATERGARQWNGAHAGRPVEGHVTEKGYLKIGLLGARVLAHRLVWLVATGAWPSGQIDHINGDRLDNRFENLRDVRQLDNSRNRGVELDHPTGTLGVSRRNGRFRARIGIGDDRVALGTYDTLDEAVSARKAGERDLGFHENHGTRPIEGG